MFHSLEKEHKVEVTPHCWAKIGQACDLTEGARGHNLPGHVQPRTLKVDSLDLPAAYLSIKLVEEASGPASKVKDPCRGKIPVLHPITNPSIPEDVGTFYGFDRVGGWIEDELSTPLSEAAKEIHVRTVTPERAADSLDSFENDHLKRPGKRTCQVFRILALRGSPWVATCPDKAVGGMMRACEIPSCTASCWGSSRRGM